LTSQTHRPLKFHFYKIQDGGRLKIAIPLQWFKGSHRNWTGWPTASEFKTKVLQNVKMGI